MLLLGTAFQKRYTGFRTTLCSFSNKESDTSHAHITRAHAHKPTHIYGGQYLLVRVRYGIIYSHTHSRTLAHTTHNTQYLLIARIEPVASFSFPCFV